MLTYWQEVTNVSGFETSSLWSVGQNSLKRQAHIQRNRLFLTPPQRKIPCKKQQQQNNILIFQVSAHTTPCADASGKKPSSFTHRGREHSHVCSCEKMKPKVWNITERKSRLSVNATDSFRGKLHESWQANIRLHFWLFLSPPCLPGWETGCTNNMFY